MILRLIAQAAQAGLGTADSLLNLTPYQLFRLLGWSPNRQRKGGNARLLELKGMLS